MARRARIYSGGGGYHMFGALMAATQRVTDELPPGLRDEYYTFMLQQQLDLPLSLSRPFRAWKTCLCCYLDISRDHRGHHVYACARSGEWWRRERHQSVIHAWSRLLRAVGSAHTTTARRRFASLTRLRRCA